MAISIPRAKIVLEIDPAKFQAGLQVAEKRLTVFGNLAKKFNGVTSKIGKAAGRGLIGAGKSIMQGMGMGAGNSIAGALGDAATSALDFEKGLTRMQIAGDLADRDMEAIRKSFAETAVASGFSRVEVLGAAKAYQELTGDTNGALEGAKLFTKVANATGSSLDDVARSAASLGDVMKIAPADMETAFSALAVGGKAGSVEMKDFAAQIAEVAGEFSQFRDSKSVEGLVQMSSAFQVIKKDAGSASETTTRFRSLMSQIKLKASELRKVGVNVFDKDPKTGVKSLRSFKAIFEDIKKSAIGRDVEVLGKVFTEKNANSAISTLLRESALMDEIARKSRDKDAINRDAAKWQNSSAGKLQQSINALKESFAEAFTPERIQGFVNAMGSLAQHLTNIVGAMDSILSGNGIKSVNDWFRKDGGAGERMFGALGISGDDLEAARYARDAKSGLHEKDFESYALDAKLKAMAMRRANRPARAAGQFGIGPMLQTIVQIDGKNVAHAVANSKDARKGVHQ